MQITDSQVNRFRRSLQREERSSGTIEKYMRDLQAFRKWQRGQESAPAADWKNHLLAQGYAPATVNSMVAAVNHFFLSMGKPKQRIKPLRLQRRLFRDTARELTRTEYGRLVAAARRHGNERLFLLMETMCATGIRVSEIAYITVEAARKGRAEIFLKGKIRTILLPGKLCRKLLKYAKKNRVAAGEIFLTRNGTVVSRHQIWAEMKRLCKEAGVQPTKVFPHNLRHLFAETFYRAYKDIVRLADVLGHSSVDTTRIYLLTTGEEHARQLEYLGLVS